MKAKELEGKVITCILPKGTSPQVLAALFDAGYTRVNFAYARGFDIHDEEARGGIPQEVEKEILTVVAKDTAQGEELFSFLFENTNMNRLGGGIMYMSALSAAVAYQLPELEISQPASGGSNPGEPPAPMAAKPH